MCPIILVVSFFLWLPLSAKAISIYRLTVRSELKRKRTLSDSTHSVHIQYQHDALIWGWRKKAVITELPLIALSIVIRKVSVNIWAVVLTVLEHRGQRNVIPPVIYNDTIQSVVNITCIVIMYKSWRFTFIYIHSVHWIHRNIGIDTLNCLATFWTFDILSMLQRDFLLKLKAFNPTWACCTLLWGWAGGLLDPTLINAI